MNCREVPKKNQEPTTIIPRCATVLLIGHLPTCSVVQPFDLPEERVASGLGLESTIGSPQLALDYKPQLSLDLSNWGEPPSIPMMEMHVVPQLI